MYRWIGAITQNHRRLRWLRRTVMAIPRPVTYSLAATIGWSVYLFARDFRETVLRNLRELLPNIDEAQRRRLCRHYTVHECLTIYEQALEYKRALRTKGGVRFHLEGTGHLDEALELGRGAIVFTPHVGNYFYSYWRLAQQYRCATVVTAGDPALRRLFLGFRRLGLRAFDYDTVPPAVLTLKLRQHLERNGVVYLLSDHSRPNFHDGTLFGRPSKIPPGAVTLSLRLRVPIVPFVGTREGWFDHRMVFKPPIHLYERYRMTERDEAMREMSHVLEQLILEAPQQWLYWFNIHERWAAQPAQT